VKPTFVPVDLTELMNEGVLMAANERFFWPFGLALTWTVSDAGYVSDLHVREWEFEDGHRESIALEPDDVVGQERRDRFDEWARERIERLPEGEQGRATHTAWES